jgi:hypothetical protein
MHLYVSRASGAALFFCFNLKNAHPYGSERG